jgi:RNA polymerase sigma factor (TIGR02999 family)
MNDSSEIPDGPAARAGLDRYAAQLYDELRRMAHRQLRGERSGHTLSTTGLVHEAYLKLSRLDRFEWKNEAQFRAEAARAMRRVLIDYAEARRAAKRGGGRVQVELDSLAALTDENLEQILALHGALEVLAAEHPRHARVVECRFFAGMTVPEIADALDLSAATVKRDWQMARAWLNRELGGENATTVTLR